MAFPFTENFNGLTDGDLNGQNGWSTIAGGWHSFVVNTTWKYEGTKGARWIDASNTFNGACQKSFTTLTGSGHVYIAVYWVSTTDLNIVLGGWRIDVNRLTANAILLAGGANRTIGSSLSASTWYLVDVEYDIDADTVRGRYHNGTSWSSYTATTTAGTAASKIEIYVNNNTTGGAAVDLITGTNPFTSGPANLKTYNTNPLANIKTINTNVIANVKTLDTNA